MISLRKAGGKRYCVVAACVLLAAALAACQTDTADARKATQPELVELIKVCKIIIALYWPGSV